MRLSALLLGLALLVPTGSSAQEQAPPKKSEAVFCCPVQGFPASREKGCCCPGGYCSKKPSPKIVLPVAGQPVQFCCTLCTDLFKKTPAKFLAHAHHQLAARQLAVQRACPLCGGKSDPAHTVDVLGVPVAACSAQCRDTLAKADPRERLNQVFGAAPFARAFTVKK